MTPKNPSYSQPAPPPGVYADVSEDEYRQWPYPSYSLLSLFRDEDKCELEVKHTIENPKDPTEQMALGTMVETAIDEPKLLGKGVEPLPPEIKVRRGTAWEEFKKLNPDTIFLPKSEYKKHESQIVQALDMGAKVLQEPLAQRIITRSERQVSFVCDLEFVGQAGELVTHRVKGRADYLDRGGHIFKDFDGGTIGDLKTSAFGNPRRVGASWWGFAYDVQSALYTDCLAQLLDKEMRFYFIAVRSIPPYVVTIYNGHNSTEMALDFLNRGRRAYQCYLEQLAECKRTGVWRGYYTLDAPEKKVLDIQIPGYAM